jgi:N5-(cytidine 5'-diphosphoramidyl)-L-glutamine hydrolase
MNTEKRVTRIGLTMRVDLAPGHGEPRDALAQDWPEFLRFAVPEIPWQPLPNAGSAVLDHVHAWKLDGFIFTGGNDIGACAIRDETEHALWEHARSHHLPVFGVCRGMQFLQHAAGGRLDRCVADQHVATTHSVEFGSITKIADLAGTRHTVNSFHQFGIRQDALPGGLQPVAHSEDGWVEALSDPQFPTLAVMWHPERGRPFRELDRQLIRRFFGLDGPP